MFFQMSAIRAITKFYGLIPGALFSQSDAIELILTIFKVIASDTFGKLTPVHVQLEKMSQWSQETGLKSVQARLKPCGAPSATVQHVRQSQPSFSGEVTGYRNCLRYLGIQ